MTTEAQLIDVRPAHRFDEARLLDYLADHVDSVRDGTTIRQFQGGQSNPTFLLTTSAGRYVLRKKPPGTLLPSAHQIEREYRVISALHGSAVPVPRPVVLCEDAAVIGTAFYVMEYVAGRVVPRPEQADLTPDDRTAMIGAMAETMAALHAVDWAAAGLADFGKPDDYLGRQIARWSRQYEASIVDGPDPAMENLTRWLTEAKPTDVQVTIAHGDFRMGNLIFAPDAPRVAAVLDWELATLGDPLADLAYCCLPYHLPGVGADARGYQGLDIEALGIPSEDAVLATYCAATGRAGIGHWSFYLAFSAFRLAAICHGVYARAKKGNASSADALEVGRRATQLSALGWTLARRS